MAQILKSWVAFVVGVRKWVPANGRATMLRDVRVIKDRARVPAVVVVHAPKMKEAWCLATTLVDKKASEIVKLYGKRFTIEETFRDEKNLHLRRRSAS
nr:hypothetical protein [Sorangium cellulosum]